MINPQKANTANSNVVFEEMGPPKAPFSSIPRAGEIKYRQDWKHPLILGLGIEQELACNVDTESVLKYLDECSRCPDRWILAEAQKNRFGMSRNPLTNEIEILNPVDNVLTSVKQILSNVTKYPPKGFTYSKLDEYALQHPIGARCLRSLIRSIAPKFIAQNVGLSSLLWTCSFASHPHKQLPAFQQLCSLWQRFQDSGTNKISATDVLHKSLSAVNLWVNKLSCSRAETVLCNYALFRYLLDQGTDSLRMPFGVDLNSQIENSEVYRNSKFSRKYSNTFSLRVTWPEGTLAMGDEAHSRVITSEDGNLERVRYKVFLDSMVGLVLCSNSIPQAVVSLLVTDPHTVSIVQMQGVQGRFLDKDGQETDRRKSSRPLIGI